LAGNDVTKGQGTCGSIRQTIQRRPAWGGRHPRPGRRRAVWVDR